MTYIEKLMSAIKFDEELLKPDEIKMLRKIISWQIQDRLCPSEITFLKGPGGGKCPLLDVGSCWDQCWDTEAASNE